MVGVAAPQGPQFYIFPYGSGEPPAGIPAEHLKVLLLIRHAQGALLAAAAARPRGAAPLRTLYCTPARTRALSSRPLPLPSSRPPSPPAGTHNVAVAKSGGKDGGLEEPEYKNEAWADARLTPFGEQQSATLQPALAALPHPGVVLVSPLSRTIQTALIAFGGAGAPAARFVSEELIRERNGAHPCDRRRPVAELAADFPAVDFGRLTAADETWTPAREPWPATVARATAFLHLLAAAPERVVAAVTHNDFLQALLLEAPELHAMEPGLRRKFQNAEVMPVWFVHGEALQAGATSAKDVQGSPR